VGGRGGPLGKRGRTAIQLPRISIVVDARDLEAVWGPWASGKKNRPKSAKAEPRWGRLLPGVGFAQSTGQGRAPKEGKAGGGGGGGAQVFALAIFPHDRKMKWIHVGETGRRGRIGASSSATWA